MLFEQSRYELAANEARLALANDPDHSDAHALLARCLTEIGELDEATTEAQTAIHLDPDDSGNHFVLGLVYYERNRLKEASDCFVQSIEFSPDHPEGYCMLSLVRYRQKNWTQALELAEEGLAIDPEHEDCANIRSLALLRLGRLDDATTGMEGALHKSPNNGMTHTSMGWTLLESGDPHKAIEHFREALRIDPELELARIGIVEALKARNIIYRMVLGFGFWLSRFSEAGQWAIIIGLYIAYRLLAQFAQANPEWSPWIQPVLWLYFGFALLTWFGDPIFNLFLRLSPTGRHALTRNQKTAANWVGILGGIAIVLLVYAFMRSNYFFAWCALIFVILGLSVSRIYDCDKGWPRRCMFGYTMLLVLLGLPSLLLLVFATLNAPFTVLNVLNGWIRFTRNPFALAALLLVFVSNWLAVREPKH